MSCTCVPAVLVMPSGSWKFLSPVLSTGDTGHIQYSNKWRQGTLRSTAVSSARVVCVTRGDCPLPFIAARKTLAMVRSSDSDVYHAQHRTLHFRPERLRRRHACQACMQGHHRRAVRLRAALWQNARLLRVGEGSTVDADNKSLRRRSGTSVQRHSSAAAGCCLRDGVPPGHLRGSAIRGAPSRHCALLKKDPSLARGMSVCGCFSRSSA
jgi:hypothetical protein